MAVTTTCSLALLTAPMKAAHIGTNTVYGTVTVAPSLSASDVIKLCRLPDRAKFVHGWLAVIPSSGTLDLKVGYLRPISSTNSGSLLANAFLLSTSGSVTAKYELSNYTGLGFQVSASDDNANKWFWLQAECVASTTQSLSVVVKFMVQYTVDD